MTAAIVLAVLAFAAAMWLLQQQGGSAEATACCLLPSAVQFCVAGSAVEALIR